MTGRVYLDHAATSWPKPEAVYTAMDAYQREVGASAGRGAYASARHADRVVRDARRAVADLLGEANETRVAFTCSGTDSLSTALFGLLAPGDHVVTTVCDHNAVARPLAELASRGPQEAVRWEIAGCDPTGFVDLSELAALVRSETRLVVINHASNVTGAVQDVVAAAQIARRHGALLLVDAAQTLGRWPCDGMIDHADVIASPGHKGLLGPLGTGVLWVRDGVEERLRPLRHGGAAGDSAARRQPPQMPARLEAGSLNVPALAGLGAGAEHVLRLGVGAIQADLVRLTDSLQSQLATTPGVRLLASPPPTACAGVVSFQVDGYDPHESATLLEQLAGVECRAGLHCAPAMHRALGSDGAVRLSVGHSTTAAEVTAATEAVRQISNAAIA